MRIYVSHSSAYDYEKILYEPLRGSNLFSIHEFFLPHEQKNAYLKADKIIGTFDALVAEASLPSTGQGIELGWASMHNLPVLCISKEGSAVSSSLKYVCTDTRKYKTPQELIAAIDSFIKTL